MDLLDSVFAAGIVGAGGAGFPTHIKLEAQTPWLLINGAECEPLIHCDKYLIRARAKDIVFAARMAAQTVGAQKIVIGIKENYHREREALMAAIGAHPEISLLLMKSFYPAGDEQVLVFEATGKTVPAGGLPKDVGATVTNVSTLCDIADALQGKAKTRRLLSLVGEVEHPLLLDVPLGIPVADCIAQAHPKEKRYSVILGGPMMGRVYSYSNIQDLSVTKTVNSIIVLPEGHYLEQRQNTPLQHMINQTNSACIQCRECTELCPRFLIGHPLHPHRVMRNIAFGNIEGNAVFEEALICCECGVCDYVCPMHLSPRRVNQMVKRTLAGKKRPGGESRPPVENRDFRKLSTDRLSHMIGISAYKKQEPEELRALSCTSVGIPLKQHIGKPAVPCVQEQDRVEAGQLIAQADRKGMGANVHASIAGIVRSIDETKIVIEA